MLKVRLTWQGAKGVAFIFINSMASQQLKSAGDLRYTEQGPKTAAPFQQAAAGIEQNAWIGVYVFSFSTLW